MWGGGGVCALCSQRLRAPPTPEHTVDAKHPRRQWVTHAVQCVKGASGERRDLAGLIWHQRDKKKVSNPGRCHFPRCHIKTEPLFKIRRWEMPSDDGSGMVRIAADALFHGGDIVHPRMCLRFAVANAAYHRDIRRDYYGKHALSGPLRTSAVSLERLFTDSYRRHYFPGLVAIGGAPGFVWGAAGWYVVATSSHGPWRWLTEHWNDTRTDVTSGVPVLLSRVAPVKAGNPLLPVGDFNVPATTEELKTLVDELLATNWVRCRFQEIPMEARSVHVLSTERLAELRRCEEGSDALAVRANLGWFRQSSHGLPEAEDGADVRRRVDYLQGLALARMHDDRNGGHIV